MKSSGDPRLMNPQQREAHYEFMRVDNQYYQTNRQTMKQKRGFAVMSKTQRCIIAAKGGAR